MPRSRYSYGPHLDLESHSSSVSGVNTHYEGSAQLLRNRTQTAYISDITQIVSVMNGTSNQLPERAACGGALLSTLKVKRDVTQLNGLLSVWTFAHFDLDYVLTPGRKYF